VAVPCPSCSLTSPCPVNVPGSVHHCHQALIFAHPRRLTTSVRPSTRRPTDPIGRSLCLRSGPPPAKTPARRSGSPSGPVPFVRSVPAPALCPRSHGAAASPHSTMDSITFRCVCLWLLSGPLPRLRSDLAFRSRALLPAALFEGNCPSARSRRKDPAAPLLRPWLSNGTQLTILWPWWLPWCFSSQTPSRLDRGRLHARHVNQPAFARREFLLSSIFEFPSAFPMTSLASVSLASGNTRRRFYSTSDSHLPPLAFQCGAHLQFSMPCFFRARGRTVEERESYLSTIAAMAKQKLARRLNGWKLISRPSSRRPAEKSQVVDPRRPKQERTGFNRVPLASAPSPRLQRQQGKRPKFEIDREPQALPLNH